MYCPKCGKENQEGAKFCMHCGADLSSYKVESSPKIEVSPKISVSAKAEGGMALKWKQKPIRYAEIKGKGKLPVFEKFIPGSDVTDIDPCSDPERFFCPQCGNYGSLVVEENLVWEYFKEGDALFECNYDLYKCQACGKLSLLEGPFGKEPLIPDEYVYLDFKAIGKVPIYIPLSYDPSILICPKCGADEPEIAYLDLYRKERKYGLYKCSACKFQYLCLQQEQDEECRYGTTHEDYFYPICEICKNRKAEYTCSSCGKQICEICVVKKGLLSKRYLCPNCK